MDILMPSISSVIKEYSQLELPDKEDYDYYLARDSRIFYLESVIYKDDDEYSQVSQIIKSIININVEDAGIPVEDRSSIIVMTDSPGGDLDLAFSLADVIKASVTPCYTVVLSEAMSAAFIIFLAGHKRFLFPHSQLLCHQGRLENMSGNSDEISAATKNYKDTLNKMREYILENTTIDAKTFAKYQKKDWYISPKQAVEEYGIADKIIGSLADIGIGNIDKNNKRVKSKKENKEGQ